VRLAEKHPRLREVETSVIVVSFERMDRVSWLQDRRKLPFTFVLDPRRKAYEAFGLGRASLLRTYGYPEVVAFYARALFRGRVPNLHGRQDRRQLGGDFVIDRDGVIVFAHPERGPEDRADVLDLIEAAERAVRRPRS
jgi:peroxiredoxin